MSEIFNQAMKAFQATNGKPTPEDYLKINALLEADSEADRAEEEDRRDIIDGIPTDRLRELAEAEQEGKIRIGSDWTPCAEGLPTIMKRVIVTICGEIVIAEREHEVDDDETTPIHWYDDEGCRFNDDVVTAWMPMPKPWTGGLDGK